MRTVAICLCLMASVNNMAYAEWGRVSDSTVRLSGDIQKGDFEKYLQIVKTGYSKLELQSFGGVPLTALKIAEDIAKRNVEVVIDGYCFSACANYLALAGKRLTVRCDSLLGWHGSPTNESDEEALRNSIAQGHPKELTTIYVKWISEFRDREQRFFKAVGVDYSLLRDSVIIPSTIKKAKPEVSFKFDQETAEISTTTTATAMSWIPTPDVLKRYGVKTSGFCQRYTHDDIQALLVKKGMTWMEFSSAESQ